MAWKYDEENRKQRLTYNDIYLDLQKKLRSQAVTYSAFAILLVFLIAFELILLLSGAEEAPLVYSLMFIPMMIISLIWLVRFACEAVKTWYTFTGIKNFTVVSDTIVGVDRHFGGFRRYFRGGKIRIRPYDVTCIIFKGYGEVRANQKIVYYDKAYVKGYPYHQHSVEDQVANLNHGDEFYLVIVDNKIEYYYSKRIFELEEENQKTS